LSDLIGFEYSRMGAHEAAEHFLARIRENTSQHDVLVPIILDGENAWEWYEGNGRPFLRALYQRISDDPRLEATTVSEALQRYDTRPLDHVVPGSWINANFDIWIGAEEDNQAWDLLLDARRVYDEHAADTMEIARLLAYEELLIAEGSDWCWWYGPEHDSDNRIEFDQLYRSHLANVYRFLGLTPPEELSRPILRVSVPAVLIPPSGEIHPVIDGEVTSYFEWIGAGLYQVEERSGAMHGKKFLVREVHFGSNGASLFLRVDFFPGYEQEVLGMQARFTLQPADGSRSCSGAVSFARGSATCKLDGHAAAVDCAFSRVLEVKVPLEAAGVRPGAGVRFQLSFWQGGLPMDAIPHQGWLEMRTTDPTEMAG
jgi:hypothetical protein